MSLFLDAIKTVSTVNYRLKNKLQNESIHPRRSWCYEAKTTWTFGSWAFSITSPSISQTVQRAGDIHGKFRKLKTCRSFPLVYRLLPPIDKAGEISVWYTKRPTEEDLFLISLNMSKKVFLNETPYTKGPVRVMYACMWGTWNIVFNSSW